MEYKEIIGPKLKSIREEYGRTQEEIASILGITTKTLDNWENGRTEMRLKSFVDICNLYQVSTDYIYGLSNDRQIKRKQKHEWQAKQID